MSHKMVKELVKIIRYHYSDMDIDSLSVSKTVENDDGSVSWECSLTVKGESEESNLVTTDLFATVSPTPPAGFTREPEEEKP